MNDLQLLNFLHNFITSINNFKYIIEYNDFSQQTKDLLTIKLTEINEIVKNELTKYIKED
jgi:hypothetical protein